jgi:hypothetical protein
MDTSVFEVLATYPYVIAAKPLLIEAKPSVTELAEVIGSSLSSKVIVETSLLIAVYQKPLFIVINLRR